MRLEKFRIRNYRSILDSGFCYPDKKITILAGKNESGKTAILEALEDFNVGKDIREDAINVKDGTKLPEVTISFEVSDEEIKKLFRKIGYKTRTKQPVTINVTKKYPNEYQIDNPRYAGFFNRVDGKNRELLREIRDIERTIDEQLDALEIGAVTFPDLEYYDYEEFKTNMESFRNAVLAHVFDPESQNAILENVNKIMVQTEGISQLIMAEDNFNEAFFELLPNFILYSSFEDEFPDSIPKNDLYENELIKDLCEISDLDPEKIGGEHATQTAHRKELNFRLQRDYCSIWSQDKAKISVDWDSEVVWFLIAEGKTHYKIKYRSKGKRWHLAFYIRVTARAKEGVENIILIDEPGLYLHAKAQKDVLKMLEKESKKTPVIFSTHSPYLLEYDKLERIRLILKKNERVGTKIIDKLHAVADKETLTPILTAIGLGVTSSIADIRNKNNVVVEGQADWFYLQGFKLLLNPDMKVNFVYGGGSGNMGVVGAILTGWGCVVLYLYDNDQGLKDGSKNLKKNWLVSKEAISAITTKEKARIEDLFSLKDFKEFVLRDSSISYDCSNSEFVKKKGGDPVLKARLFLSLCEENPPALSSVTLSCIKELFERLESYFQ